MLKKWRELGGKSVLGISLSMVLIALPQQVIAHPSNTSHYHLAQQAVTLKQAVAKVQKHYGGDVLKAEPTKMQGRSVYRIRLMSNGRVREFLVDAGSGELVQP